MKIILSRKGFDTTYGQRPSPILPDNSLISLPIPNMRFTSGILYNNTKYSPLQYKNLQIPNNVRKSLIDYDVNVEKLLTYHDLMSQLFSKRQFKDNNTWYSLDKEKALYCHLDPDIRHDILPRPQEWKPIFGQEGTAQTHLENNKVEVGDLFLYYGWFQKTKVIEGKLSYDGPMNGGIHIIFGYLQIGSIIKKDKTKIEPWMVYHPHFDKELWNEKKGNKNTFYIANEVLTLNNNYSGAGFFKYSDELVLTEQDPKINPNKNLTKWKYSYIPFKSTISFNLGNVGWNKERKFFKSPEIGQEMVVSDSPSFIEKIKKFFK
jgi:hypothetical protein